jgi:hypothetical protein
MDALQSILPDLQAGAAAGAEQLETNYVFSCGKVICSGIGPEPAGSPDKHMVAREATARAALSRAVRYFRCFGCGFQSPPAKPLLS